MPGGLGAIAGQEWFGVPPQFTTLIGGVGLVCTVVLNPDGIAPPAIEGFERLWRRVSGLVQGTAGHARDPGGDGSGQPPGPGTGVAAMPATRAGEEIAATSSRAEDPV
jgi:hypothetical protein